MLRIQSNGRLSSICKRSLSLSGLLFGWFLVGSSAFADEVVVVDFADIQGIADPIASGFHGGLSDEVPAELFYPLRPSAFRAPEFSGPSAPMDSIWERSANTGAVLIMRFKRGCGLGGPFDSTYWNCLQTEVFDVVDLAMTMQDSFPNLGIHYDVWNEADVCPLFWNGTTEEFYEMWDSTYTWIKERDENNIVTGPTFGRLFISPGEYDTTGCGDMDPNITDFLIHADSTNHMPDVLGLHSIPYTHETDAENNMFADIDTVRKVMVSLGIDTTGVVFEINEMMRDHQYLVSGSMVRHFSLAERSKSLGLLLAGRTYWCDPRQPDSAECVAGTAGSPELGHLGGVIDPLSGPNFEKRYAWWTAKAYADITGELVRLDSTGVIDGVAGKDSTAVKAGVLLGRYRDSGSDTVVVRLKNIDEFLTQNGAIEVLASRLYGQASNGVIEYDSTRSAGNWVEPNSVLHGAFPVLGDSLEITLTGVHFGPSNGRDAVTILLAPPDPDTVTVLGDHSTIQLAINAAEAGDLVFVTPDSSGAPFDEVIQMKSGVRVLGLPNSAGETPIIEASGDTAVVFPNDANEFTILEGFEIRAGESMDVIVSLRESGSIKNCTLSDNSNTPDYGIRAVNHTGIIDNCTITLTTAGYAATGIDLISSSSTISNCQINTGNQYSSSQGIVTDANCSAVITNTFVKSENVGIYSRGTTLAKFCTVDSTNFEGIQNGNDTVTENCIVTNVTNSSTRDGIIGGTVKYCIAPDGITAPTEVDNSTVDPFYCGSGDYTLRVDSYGNPNHNPSGLIIGAYPVACMFGSLTQNSVFGNGVLSVTADATIPSGKSLILTPGAILEADSTVLITANGVLRATGTESDSVIFRGSLPNRGHWSGIRAQGNGDGIVSLTYAGIYDAVNCVSDGLDTPNDSLYIQHVRMGNFETAGVSARPMFKAANGSSPVIRVLGSVIDMSGAPRGIYINMEGADLTPSYNTQIANSSVFGDASGVYGIYLNVQSKAPDREADVEGVTISGLDAGTGLYVKDYSPHIFTKTPALGDSILFDDCKWGIQLHGSGKSVISGEDGPFHFNGCSTSLYVTDTCDPDVDDLIIKNVQGSYSWGVHTDATCKGTYDGLTITDGRVGFYAFSTEDHELRSSAITQFELFGVQVSAAGMIDLGTSQNAGNNIIHSNDTTNPIVLFAGVKNRVAELGDVKAEKNWWGADPPDTADFSVAIDYTPWLTSAPSLSFDGGIAGLATVEIPVRPSLAIRPNPSKTEEVIIEFAVPFGAGKVSLDLFDISGRRVRNLVLGEPSPGVKVVTWDGRNDQGQRSAVGVYFLRYQTSKEVVVSKIIRLP